MPTDPEKQAAIQAQLDAVESALSDNRFYDAHHYLAQATQLGASKRELHHFRLELQAGEAKQSKQRRGSFWMGLFLSLCAYLLLALQQPLDWGIPLWMLLGFFCIPVLTGYVVGRKQGFDQGAKARFGAAFRANGLAMFLYTSLSLMFVHADIGSGGNSTMVFLVGLVVSVVYGILAGCVAGIASAKLAWWGRKERKYESAS